uniref:Uncharacterized protein n=1 Tax=Micrurus surinamensis TaxID=129470 RepID=A0A2D4PIT2_MICSU
MIRYKELVDEQGELKTLEELKEQGIILDWWAYMQIQVKFKKDSKEQGIDKEVQKLDQILTGKDTKFITRTYNYLLEVELEEKIVKGPMIAWARNVGHNINLDEWEKI